MSFHTPVRILTIALLAVVPSVTLAAGAAAADQRTDQARNAVEFPRQVMPVLFYKPVKVGDRILFGKYIIEHDNERMRRGRPCTHVYDASDPRLPVVAFHCTHLTRPETAEPVVLVRPLRNASGMTELIAYQFAGETSAHGVPGVR